MLYSGHFSFDENGKDGDERHGYFTCIASAATPELALLKFRQRIQAIRNDIKEPLFKDIVAVYVEDIVEIADIPDEAVMTRFQSSEGPFPKSRSCSLPTTHFEDIKAFQWLPASEEDAAEPHPPEHYKEAVPFIRFT
ncbi:MAG TPA: hypothetical protein DHV36_12055 [Desulfobacteraceae bacterium]|nr:hypothetical protein [Desulfobacteraceae bacterium]